MSAVEKIKIYPNPMVAETEKEEENKVKQVKASELDRVFKVRLDKFEEMYQQAKKMTAYEAGKRENGEDMQGGGAGQEALTTQSKTLLSILQTKGELKFDPSLLDFSFENLKRSYFELPASKPSHPKSNESSLKKNFLISVLPAAPFRRQQQTSIT